MFHYFFSKHSKTLIISIFFSIVVLISILYYWNIHRYNSLYKAAISYERIINELSDNNVQILENIEKFVNENNNSYGALASLNLVKKYIDNNEIEKAAKQLKRSLKNVRDSNLQAVMNLRLARIQLQQGQADSALKTLDYVKGEGWKAIVEDIRGEALLSKGDKLGANKVWKKGIASEEALELKEIMQIKMKNLG